MLLPSWIPFLVAAWVIAFGIMRIRISIKKSKETEEQAANRPNYRKGGYYARSSKSHMIYGISYLALGGYCIAMGLGYHYDFTGGCAKTAVEEPEKNTGGLPVGVTDG